MALEFYSWETGVSYLGNWSFTPRKANSYFEVLGEKATHIKLTEVN